jgi:hypothetical protein
MNHRFRTGLIALVATTTVLITTGVGVGLSASPNTSGGKKLSGTLVFTAGSAHRVHGKVDYVGTYFRMLKSKGTDQYFPNVSSKAPNDTYTFLSPGSEHGLELGRYQPPPKHAFNSSNGNALASSITKPQAFVGIKFSISTAPKSAQGGKPTPAPSLVLRGNKLTGNLSAWTAEWNEIYFNQGAPKPGSNPYPGIEKGLTEPVTGTYNSKTHAFTITWYSLIVGGPFNGYAGFWHLQGHLEG